MKVTVIPIVVGALGTSQKVRKGNRGKRRSGLVWFDLVGFYGQSTIVGYLMPNSFVYI